MGVMRPVCTIAQPGSIQQIKENYMLVTFTTDAYANITMFGDNALDALKMMGHSATVPGAIKPEDITEALSRLKTATESEKIPPNAENKNAEDQVVSIAHRMLPLINLLSAAAKANSYVMWDKSTSLS
jgi:hypothetical protein